MNFNEFQISEPICPVTRWKWLQMIANLWDICIFQFGCRREKNNSDQSYSSPRDWRLSTSWGPSWEPLKAVMVQAPTCKPSEYHSIIVFSGLSGSHSWPHIMPRDAILLDSECFSCHSFVKFASAPAWKFYSDQMYTRPRGSAFRHNGDSIKDPPEILRTSR